MTTRNSELETILEHLTNFNIGSVIIYQKRLLISYLYQLKNLTVKKSMELLKAQNIEKKFVNHLALDDVNVSIPENSIYGLLGPNGAGKTTLIRIINRITAPDKGEILLKGRLLQPEDVNIIGYLPEERGLYKKMKVGEQALYLARLKGLSKQDALKRLKYWFEKFEMQAWWDKKVEELSKGMAQKVQFVTTILHEPELLIFDEPFSGFDPINANMLKQGKVGHIADSLNSHRRHQSSVTASSSSNARHLAEIIFMQDYVASLSEPDEDVRKKAKEYVEKIYTQFDLDPRFAHNPKLNNEVNQALNSIS